MRKTAAFLFAVLAWTTLSFAQSGDVEPILSKNPLTAEQIDAYRTLLRFFTRDSDRTINLDKVTTSLDVTELSQDEECRMAFGPIDFEKPKETMPTVHLLDPGLEVAGHVVLVNVSEQVAYGALNSPPQALVEGTFFDQSRDAGLFSLSEIAFSKDHSTAVVMFSFACGRRCGGGAILMLRRIGPEWTVAEQSCREWVS